MQSEFEICARQVTQYYNEGFTYDADKQLAAGTMYIWNKKCLQKKQMIKGLAQGPLDWLNICFIFRLEMIFTFSLPSS